jgi:hypothetical protein
VRALVVAAWVLGPLDLLLAVLAPVVPVLRGPLAVLQGFRGGVVDPEGLGEGLGRERGAGVVLLEIGGDARVEELDGGLLGRWRGLYSKGGRSGFMYLLTLLGVAFGTRESDLSARAH